MKQIPDQLESLMAEKRLLQAAILVVRSVKAINKPEMLDIGALTDLRSYLTAQETALREILIEELNSHLYLKTFWCDSRWVAYVPGQQTRTCFTDSFSALMFLKYHLYLSTRFLQTLSGLHPPPIVALASRAS